MMRPNRTESGSVWEFLLARITEDGDPCGVEQTVRHLATIYADHPDYREEWDPVGEHVSETDAPTRKTFREYASQRADN